MDRISVWAACLFGQNIVCFSIDECVLLKQLLKKDNKFFISIKCVSKLTFFVGEAFFAFRAERNLKVQVVVAVFVL